MKQLLAAILCSALIVSAAPRPLHGPTVYEEIGTAPWTNEDIRIAFKEFASIYKQRPLKTTQDNIQLPHLFYIWFIAKQLQPEVIIESGSLQGQSTWVLECAAPRARIFSLNPDPFQLKYRLPRVTYSTKDFTQYHWIGINKEKTLCFFNDHHGVQRIHECQELGFRHIICNNNDAYPGLHTHQHSIKWSFLATRLMPMQLKNIVAQYSKFNKAHSLDLQRAFAYSLKTRFEHEHNHVAYLLKALDTYYEFPPLVAMQPQKSNWPHHIFRNIMKKPLYKTLPSWFKQRLSTHELHYAFLAYIHLQSIEHTKPSRKSHAPLEDTFSKNVTGAHQ